METQQAIVIFDNEEVSVSVQRVPMIGETIVVRDWAYKVIDVTHKTGSAYLDVGGGIAPEKKEVKPFRIPISYP